MAVVTHRKLQLVRMQADGNIVDLGSFTFPSPPFSYSVARSHDGVTFAIGGDRGFLMIATFVEQREPRWRQEAGLVLGNPNVRDNNMLNGVRFARFGGKEYLMAAAQVPSPATCSCICMDPSAGSEIVSHRMATCTCWPTPTHKKAHCQGPSARRHSTW